jgi:cystathionine beta-lyase
MTWNFDEAINREGSHCIKYDLREEIFGRIDVIPMWVADMDFRTPDFIVSRLRERMNHEIYGYTFRQPEYFTSIIEWVNVHHNWLIEKDWICFTPGIVPALNLCTLSFTRPGDSIIVQPPVYFPFFGAVENHGRKLVYNQLAENNGRWTMDLDSLVSSIDETTKMIIICNPHNPVGRAWSFEELENLASICLKKNILIVSDEIHCDLVLPGFNHTPLAKISKEVEEITVTCIAPSKTFNLAGLATSSLIIPNSVFRKYFNKKIDSLHIGNGNIFGIEASIAAYSEGHQWLGELIEYISVNVDLVNSYCRELIPEIIPCRTEATYMIWLDCRKFGMNSKDLQEFFIRRAGVGMNEGSTFGPGGEGFMRMNIATTRQTVITALEQIEKAVSEIR